MSRHDHIDRLFKSKLEHRSFPMEANELEAAQALIAAHGRHTALTGVLAGAKLAAAALAVTGIVVWAAWPADRPASDDRTATGMEPAAIRTMEAGTHVHANAMASLPGAATVPNDLAKEPLASPPVATPRTVRAAKAIHLSPSAFFPVAAHRDALPQGGGYAAEIERGSALERAVMERLAARTPDRAPLIGTPSPLAAPEPAPLRTAFGEVYGFAQVAALSNAHSAIGHVGRFGVEYRFRAGPMSLATGFHSSRYTLHATASSEAAAAQLSYVGMPLLVGRTWHRGRWSAGLQGGALTEFLFTASMKHANGTPISTASFNDDAFRKLNLSLLLRPQLTYQFNERFGARIALPMLGQLHAPAATGPGKDMRHQGLGMELGIAVNLQHHTY